MDTIGSHTACPQSRAHLGLPGTPSPRPTRGLHPYHPFPLEPTDYRRL